MLEISVFCAAVSVLCVTAVWTVRSYFVQDHFFWSTNGHAPNWKGGISRGGLWFVREHYTDPDIILTDQTSPEGNFRLYLGNPDASYPDPIRPATGTSRGTTSGDNWERMGIVFHSGNPSPRWFMMTTYCQGAQKGTLLIYLAADAIISNAGARVSGCRRKGVRMNIRVRHLHRQPIHLIRDHPCDPWFNRFAPCIAI
jgi:hypothetical protein